jgi:hypothetical protein
MIVVKNRLYDLQRKNCYIYDMSRKLTFHIQKARAKTITPHIIPQGNKRFTFESNLNSHESQCSKFVIRGVDHVIVIGAAWWQTQLPPRAGVLGTMECYMLSCAAYVVFTNARILSGNYGL